MSLFNQLPRLSAYDPGAVGEGGLDPLGLAAVADRIADILVPGVRARMSLPRFVTVSAVGAVACQALQEMSADEGKTTADIAFEWIVVEAILRNPGSGRKEGLPGNQKAERARAAKERLSRRTYLNGPRVFGFTGVYRPLSRNLNVLTSDDRPAEKSARLLNAWELDFDLPGYVDGVAGSQGGRLRRDITDACRRTLEKGECAVPPNAQLFAELSRLLAPREAKKNERRVLRELITGGTSEIRNELTAKLVANPPPTDVSQRRLAQLLMHGASALSRRAIQASIDYEEAATALDNTFRRFLAHTTEQHGCVIKPAIALQTQGLAELAPRIDCLVQRAVDSVAELGDPVLSDEVQQGFRRFGMSHSPGTLFEAIVERHEEVQARKRKLSWLDRIDGDWTVRIPYRNQEVSDSDEQWTHPMRLVTLANLLRETA